MFDLYLEYEYWFAATQLALAMLGMGATLRIADFVQVVRAPLGMAVGLLTQLVSVPLLAAGLGTALSLEPGLAVGLVLVAAVPGGTMSNVATYLARGNIALSISLTGVTTLGCLVVTPLLLRLFASSYLPADFEMPAGRIAFEIATTLLGPLAAGMAIGARFPAHSDAFARWCIRGSLFVILLIVIGAAGAGRIDPQAYGWIAIAAMVLFCALAQQAGLVPSWLLRLPPRDTVAIGLECTIRNTNLALLIKASIFPAIPGVADPVADGVLFVALLYGGIALFLAAPPLMLSRRREAAAGG